MNDDTLISWGGVVKSLGSRKVGGYGVLFTSAIDPDREGEFFHKGTDFDLEDRGSLPVFWHHGLDACIGRRKLSRAIPLVDDKGVFVETTLPRGDEISEKILALAEQDQLAWSSGSALHLVEKQAFGNVKRINYWPLTEFSLLGREQAAEPRNTVSALKHFQTTRTWADLTSELEAQQFRQSVVNEYTKFLWLQNERRRRQLRLT